MTERTMQPASIALRNTVTYVRPVSGLTSGDYPGESPSRAVRSGVLIHLVSFTVAGAAPELSLS